MADPVRVTVSTDDDAESVRIHDNSGRVDVDGVSFSFDLDGDGRAGGDTPAADPSDDPTYIAPLTEVPVHGSIRCEGRSDDRGIEFIVRREGEAVVAWRNACPHRPEIPLDPGRGVLVTDKHLVCHEHGARFVRGEGECSSGPCQGAMLAPIEVTVEDSAVYCTDDRFDACRVL